MLDGRSFDLYFLMKIVRYLAPDAKIMKSLQNFMKIGPSWKTDFLFNYELLTNYVIWSSGNLGT